MLVLSTAMLFLKDGKIKALSESYTTGVPQLPDVKHIGEEDGFAGMALPLWQGLFLKAGTRAATVAAYDKALRETLAQPELRQKLQEVGITVAAMGGRVQGFHQTAGCALSHIVTSSKITMA